MKIIYKTIVTGIGKFAAAFCDEKLIILFKDNAPEELADYCVLHTGNEVLDSVRQGDVLVAEGTEYKVTYVGDEVLANLKNLGHITLRFDGRTEGLGGSICLEEKVLPDIRIGGSISIYRE